MIRYVTSLAMPLEGIYEIYSSPGWLSTRGNGAAFELIFTDAGLESAGSSFHFGEEESHTNHSTLWHIHRNS